MISEATVLLRDQLLHELRMRGPRSCPALWRALRRRGVSQQHVYASLRALHRQGLVGRGRLQARGEWLWWARFPEAPDLDELA